MPTIAYFYGIAISMYYNDHNPPHFHARYGRAKEVVRISDGRYSPANCRRPQLVSLEPGRRTGNKTWKATGVADEGASRSSAWQVLMGKADFPLVDVLRLRPLEGNRLWLRFSDGCEGVRDLSQVILGLGPVSEPLKDPSYFNRVFIESGVPTWPNGFDLDPIQLYMELRDAGLLTKPNATVAE